MRQSFTNYRENTQRATKTVSFKTIFIQKVAESVYYFISKLTLLTVTLRDFCCSMGHFCSLTLTGARTAILLLILRTGRSLGSVWYTKKSISVLCNSAKENTCELLDLLQGLDGITAHRLCPLASDYKASRENSVMMLMLRLETETQ